MYYVVFFKDSHPENQYCRGPFLTVKDAANAREVNGDVVTDLFGVVVNDPSWLFDWEDNSCYAARRMGMKIPLKPFRIPKGRRDLADFIFMDALSAIRTFTKRIQEDE